jgi:hypothetical protein
MTLLEQIVAREQGQSDRVTSAEPRPLGNRSGRGPSMNKTQRPSSVVFTTLLFDCQS